MGGNARSLILPLPIGPRGISSWTSHQHRKPRSTEPGTDIYADTGTPVVAPADGVIYGYGESVIPATGRWVGIDFDNGMSFRCMHHSRILRKSGRVRQGDEIALSGSSGYGSDFFGEKSRNTAFWNNTGGDHSHVTLWPTRDKRYGYGRDGDPDKPYTIDIMDFIVSLAGVGAKPFTPPAAPLTIRPLEVNMAGFNPVQPLYRHTGLNQYLVLDLLTKRARLIAPGDWEQTLINEENERIADRVRNVEKRDLHVTDPIHRDITPEQWATAYGDFTYTYND